MKKSPDKSAADPAPAVEMTATDEGFKQYGPGIDQTAFVAAPPTVGTVILGDQAPAVVALAGDSQMTGAELTDAVQAGAVTGGVPVHVDPPAVDATALHYTREEVDALLAKQAADYAEALLASLRTHEESLRAMCGCADDEPLTMDAIIGGIAKMGETVASGVNLFTQVNSLASQVALITETVTPLVKAMNGPIAAVFGRHFGGLHL